MSGCRRKCLFLSIGAALLASAGWGAGFVARANASAPPPFTTNNDDSCDIGVAPAATLLLPYFEVDLETAGTGRTTLFSITNVSPFPQIARLTIWTDWAYPVLTFNLFLTGYDVESINLFDVIARGVIGGPVGTSTSSPNGWRNPTIGSQPLANQSNPNFAPSAAITCAPGRLPGQLPQAVAADVRALLTRGRSTGTISCSSGGVEKQVGANHGSNTAIGYVTIDVVSTCANTLPTQPNYYSNEILFDNVLIGDYQEVSQGTAAGNFAGGNPLVHIRATPEGGGAGSVPPGVTNLPFTFYDRFTAGNPTDFRNIDRRQPLPSAFAARWISGESAMFETSFKIWREGVTGADAKCDEYAYNGDIPLLEIVRFDERENATLAGVGWVIAIPWMPGLPATARVPVTSSVFPPKLSTDVGGWMYLNLHNEYSFGFGYGRDSLRNHSVSRGAGSWNVGGWSIRPAQNWVIVSLAARAQYAVEFDAVWLGNGCSPAAPGTWIGVAQSSANRISPIGGALVCPDGTSRATLCTGKNTTP